MSRIGIIGLSSIEILGIKGLLSDIPESLPSSVELSVYGSFNSFRRDSDKIDLFIVGISIFVSHIDFFMPRKSRLVVLNSECSPFNSEVETESNFSGLNLIFRDTPEDLISEVLCGLITDLSGKGEVSGELSLREKEVLKELARGKTNKEIADILSISVNTVITHRKNISAKLGIKSVSGLSLYALMNGVI